MPQTLIVLKTFILGHINTCSPFSVCLLDCVLLYYSTTILESFPHHVEWKPGRCCSRPVMFAVSFSTMVLRNQD